MASSTTVPGERNITVSILYTGKLRLREGKWFKTIELVFRETGLTPSVWLQDLCLKSLVLPFKKIQTPGACYPGKPLMQVLFPFSPASCCCWNGAKSQLLCILLWAGSWIYARVTITLPMTSNFAWSPILDPTLDLTAQVKWRNSHWLLNAGKHFNSCQVLVNSELLKQLEVTITE